MLLVLVLAVFSGCAGNTADSAGSVREGVTPETGAAQTGTEAAQTGTGAAQTGTEAARTGTEAARTGTGESGHGDSRTNFIPYTFTDSTGNEVTLTERPEKVAVLFSSLADIWELAGGDVEVTVGETLERGFAHDSAELVDAGAGKTIDNELLVSYEPDLVIGSADIQAHVETAKLLEETGIPCALFRVDSLEDYLAMLKICTEITGNEDCYQENGIQVKERVDAILEQTAGQKEQKRILFIRSGSGESSARAKTADQHFAAKMLQELGAYNIADNATVLLDGLSLEEILAQDPDFIFIATMGEEATARAYMDSVLAQKAWQSLTAVKEKKYVYLPKDLFQFKPNARWDEAYAYLAKLLYP